MCRLPRPVDVGPMRGTVEEHDLLVLEDLVDDPEVAAPSRVQSFELPAKRLARSPRIEGNRLEDRRQDSRTYLFRELVELTARLGRRLNRVRRATRGPAYLGRSSGERRP